MRLLKKDGKIVVGAISDWKKQNIDPETDLGKAVARTEAEMAKLDTIIGSIKKQEKPKKKKLNKKKLLSNRAKYEGLNYSRSFTP